jgi:hypothetical protein
MPPPQLLLPLASMCAWAPVTLQVATAHPCGCCCCCHPAGLFDVAKALSVGLKVGLGTDIAGCYSPSMLLPLLLLLLLPCAGLFDVAKALSVGLKVGLGTDIAGGYSPSMLQAQRMAVVNSHALKAAALMYGSWRAQEQQQQQADSTLNKNCKEKEQQQQQGGGHQEHEQQQQQQQQQEEPGHSNKQLQQATASTASKLQLVVIDSFHGVCSKHWLTSCW